MATGQETESEGRSVAMMLLGAGALLAVLVGILVAVSGMGLFSHRLTATSYFSDAEGIKSGAAVNLNGVNIGTVKTVTITTAPERKKTPVLVTMRINPKFKDSVRTDSLAGLTNLGALADTVIDIDSEHATGPPMQDGVELKTLNNASVLDLKAGQDTVKKLNDTEARLNTVVDQMTNGKGTIGKIMSDPGLMNRVTATTNAVSQVNAKLNSTNNSLGKLLNDHSLTDKVASLGTDMQGVTASYTKLTNGPLQGNIDSVTTHANSIVADLNAGKGGAGMLMKNPKQLTDTLAKANALLNDYSKNPKTGGNFAAGGATSVDLQKLSTEVNALSTMMRSNPKQYFTIQVRLF
jgi:phospholipid/cholesterol/gamma-HCH transport system substrate-binding protein